MNALDQRARNVNILTALPILALKGYRIFDVDAARSQEQHPQTP